IAWTALLFATFFVLPGFGLILNVVLRTRWGWLLNLSHTIRYIWAVLFRVPLGRFQPPGIFGGPLPLWADWASLLAVCAFSLWLLDRRLRAREVERGCTQRPTGPS